MTIKFKNENLNKPASEKQLAFLSELLAQAVKQATERQPTEKGQKFVNGLTLPEFITTWEASSLIEILKLNGYHSLLTYSKVEHDRRAAGEPLTSSCNGAAIRSVFPAAYKALFE